MMRLSRERALRGVSEVALIVVGVFVALAVDSYWEQRGERRRVEGYTRSLATDLRAAREAVDSVLLATEQMIARLDEFMGEVESGGTGAKENRVPTVRLQPPRLPLGMLDVLISTGDVNLISDAEMRAEIIRQHSRLLSAVQEAGEFAVQMRLTASEEYRWMEELRDADGSRPTAATARRSPQLLSTIRFQRATQAAYRARLVEIGDAIQALLAAIGKGR